MKRFRINGAFGRLAFIGVVIALLLAGCGSGSHPPYTNQPPQVTILTAGAVLRHMPQGSVLFNWTPNNQTLNVNVRLYGLAPNSTHPNSIGSGSCSNQGSVVYSLKSITADAHGVADVTTQIKNVKKGIPVSGWYLNVQNGPGNSSSDQSLSIACANISNPAPTTTSVQQMTTQIVSAAGTSNSESASGSASLRLSNGTLTVKLSLSGLQPQSTHAAHIHSGSCQSQGPVVYPLNTVKADASGNASVTTTIQNVKTIPASGWYINVHQSTDMSSQTGFDPIACDVVQRTS